jgi:hypothetical protein
MNAKRKILFTLLTLLIVVVLIESAARFVHLFFPVYKDKTSVWVEHSTFHHWHKANADDISRADTGEYNVPVRTNSFGMPGKEYSIIKQQNVFRIALLGDSFVEGFSTREEDSIAVMLEEHMNESAAGKIEVLNFGCSSFSPSLEYYLLQRFVEKFSPDMVVLLFHVTDVSNDWEYEKYKVLDKNGRTVGINGHTDKGGLYTTLEKSVFLRAVVQKIKLIKRLRRLDVDKEYHLTDSYFAMFKDEYSELDQKAWELTQSYITLIREWADNAGVPFLIVAIPVGSQVEALVMNSGEKSKFPQDWQNLESTKMQDILFTWAKNTETDYLDLLPYAKAYKENNKNEILFYPQDQHFTLFGNRVAAKAIYKKIIEIKE